ncbi:MAG: hypothetical protein ABIH49_03010 [archaeon]
MNFIKKIFQNKVDGKVHAQFQKFSKGEFRNRAMINAKATKDKFTINTSSEFAGDVIRIAAEKLGKNKAKVSGAVISTSDLTDKIDFKSKKQFQGVKNYAIENEMSGDEIISLLDEFPKTFFALSFEAPEISIKIKPKAPMSGKPKPAKEGEKQKVDFCKLITTNREIADSFVFEKPNWKNAEIKHTFLIDEIKIPNELKNEKDFAVVREKALRKGKIIREAIIDGERMKREVGMEV